MLQEITTLNKIPKHKHEWKPYSLAKSDFKCYCGALGKQYRVWDERKKAYKWIVRRVDR